jgi:opacity protein-like surface antigen
VRQNMDDLKKGLVTAAIIIAGVAVSGLAMAQSADRENRWETRVGVTFDNSTKWDFDGGTTADLKSDTGFLLGFAYHYTDKLEFGANFEFTNQGYTANIASGTDPGLIYPVKGGADTFRIMGDGTYNFLPGKFTPFVTGAIGWTWMDTNIATSPPQTGCWWDPWWGYICTTYQNTKSINGFTYQLGAGLRYDINDQFDVKASYRMTWTDLSNAKGTPDQDGFVLSVGWKF